MFERRASIASRRRIGPRFFVLHLSCPEIAAAARAGQFVMVSVTDAIDPLLRRPMAIYGIVRKGGVPVGISLLIEEHGRGTRLLGGAAVGQELSILGPLGQPFRFAAADAAEPWLIMGGVGAAPFPLLAAQMREEGLRPRAFIGSRTAADLLCRDEFTALGVPVHVATEDGSAGHAGLVTGLLREHLASADLPPRLYSCGPTAMMRAVHEIAAAAGLRHQVSLEAPMACGIGVCLSCVVRVGTEASWTYQRICREGPVFEASELLWAAP